ncbi:hypothetical protein QR680_011200 [Steinernema hermaphroditum]|uniref:Uncharacterized protein n=1 Tax=Steinernema hermaphroditum TaxID=289476 RepID=A0AA39IRF4_9BILA|nr:hypothetical protein QR680_011200 [Steinernema hermaphroditum]
MIKTRKRFWHSWTYKIIFHMGIVDLVGLLPCFTSSIANFTGSDLQFLAKIIVNVMSIFDVQALLVVVLALNRMLIVTRITSLDRPIVYKTLITLCWMMGIVFLSLSVSTTLLAEEIRYSHKSHFFSVYYSVKKSRLHDVQEFSYYALKVFSASSIIFYLVIFIYVVKQQKARSILFRREFLILLPGLETLIWNVSLALFSSFSTEIKEAVGDGYFLIYKFILFTHPAVHFVVYLTCNSQLRKEVKKLFIRKKVTTSGGITVTTWI